jgi:hypothetical protein
VPTLRLCVLYGSENKQRHLPYTTLTDCFFITEVQSVYSAVCTESLYKTDKPRLEMAMPVYCFIINYDGFIPDASFSFFSKVTVRHSNTRKSYSHIPLQNAELRQLEGRRI